MKKLSLRPYHGTIHLCRTLKELRSEYKRLTKEKYPYEDSGGRVVKLDRDDGTVIWLVWGRDLTGVVHELSHVLLWTFRTIGHNPCDGDGEPFCYMLSALMNESGYYSRLQAGFT